MIRIQLIWQAIGVWVCLLAAVYSAGVQPKPEATDGAVSWAYNCNSLPALGPLIAVKDGAAERDSTRTFVAGALFGLASAALLEALGELVAALDRRRAARARQRKHGPNLTVNAHLAHDGVLGRYVAKHPRSIRARMTALTEIPH